MLVKISREKFICVLSDYPELKKYFEDGIAMKEEASRRIAERASKKGSLEEKIASRALNSATIVLFPAGKYSGELRIVNYNMSTYMIVFYSKNLLENAFVNRLIESSEVSNLNG